MPCCEVGVPVAEYRVPSEVKATQSGFVLHIYINCGASAVSARYMEREAEPTPVFALIYRKDNKNKN